MTSPALPRGYTFHQLLIGSLYLEAVVKTSMFAQLEDALHLKGKPWGRGVVPFCTQHYSWLFHLQTAKEMMDTVCEPLLTHGDWMQHPSSSVRVQNTKSRQ